MCVCVDRQYYNVRMAGFFSSWWVEWDSGCGCVFRGQAARHTCMLVVLSFAVLDVRPPSFSFSLIRTSNFSAVDSSNECGGGDDGGLLGLFRAALGEVLQQDPAKRGRRLSMTHSIQIKSTPFRTCRSCPPSCSWVSWPGLKTTERWSPRARTLHSEREERPFSHLLLSW